MPALETLPEAIRRFQREPGQITYTAKDGKQRTAPRDFGFDPACPGDWKALLGCLGEAMRAGLLPKQEEVARRFPGVPPTTVHPLLIMFAWVASEQRVIPITGRHTSAFAAAACSLWPDKAVPDRVWELVGICINVMKEGLKKTIEGRTGVERIEKVPEIVLLVLAGWKRGPLFSPATPDWSGTPTPVKQYWKRRVGYDIEDFFDWAQTPGEEREKLKQELLEFRQRQGRSSACENEGETSRSSASKITPDEARPPSQADEERNDAPDMTEEIRSQFGRVIGLRVTDLEKRQLVARVHHTYLALPMSVGRCNCYTRKERPKQSMPGCVNYHSIHPFELDNPDKETVWEHSGKAFVGIPGQEAFAFHGKYQEQNCNSFSGSILADAFSTKPSWNKNDKQWNWRSSGRKIAARRVAHWTCPDCAHPNVLYLAPESDRADVACSWCTNLLPGGPDGPYGIDESKVRIIEESRLVLLVDGQGDASPDEQAVEERKFWRCEKHCAQRCGAAVEVCPKCQEKKPKRKAVLSPDGTKALTCWDDKKARVWETASGREILCLAGHTKTVTCAAISPAGTHLLTGSNDITVRLWDAASGVELHCFTGHTNAKTVTCVSFSSDGNQVLAKFGDESERLWDAKDGREIDLSKKTEDWTAAKPDDDWICDSACGYLHYESATDRSEEDESNENGRELCDEPDGNGSENGVASHLQACPRCGSKRPNDPTVHTLWVARTMRFIPSGGDSYPPWARLAAEAFSEHLGKEDAKSLEGALKLLDSLVDWWDPPSLAPILADELPDVNDPVWAALGMAPPEWMVIRKDVREILQEALDEAKEYPGRRPKAPDEGEKIRGRRQDGLDQFLTLHGLLHGGARKWHPHEGDRVRLLRLAFRSLLSEPPEQWRWLLAEDVCPRDNDFWNRLSAQYYETFNKASRKKLLPDGARPAWKDWKIHHHDVREAFVSSARLFGQSQLIAIADPLRP